jgi:3-oxoacyl-[acyl-carrier protein] reductase
MTRLGGKLCVVTGASSGIGAAVARALAADGAAVVGLARRFPPAAAAPQPGRVVEAALDVTDEAAVRARFTQLGAVDVLINCAGAGTFAPLVNASVAELRTMLDVHVVGTFLCCREALRGMMARRSGHIVNVGSVAARRSFADCSGYTAAKSGQLGLTQVLAEEARPYGVRVTALLAGAVDTPIWDDRPGFDRSKMMRPEDFAAVVADLVARRGVAVDELVVLPPGGTL